MALRKTKQREAIRKAFEDNPRPLSPQEVLDLAQLNSQSLSLATVYRALRDLEEHDYLRAVSIPGQPDRYELAGLEHHHHFCCTGCDRVYDIAGCPGTVSDLTPEGFAVKSHEILLYGECAACVCERAP